MIYLCAHFVIFITLNTNKTLNMTGELETSITKITLIVTEEENLTILVIQHKKMVVLWEILFFRGGRRDDDCGKSIKDNCKNRLCIVASVVFLREQMVFMMVFNIFTRFICLCNF